MLSGQVQRPCSAGRRGGGLQGLVDQPGGQRRVFHRQEVGLVRQVEVTAAAKDGSDAQCVAAVRQFTAFLGNAAGNLALTLGARGGVYLGGGIVPRLGSAFDASLFRRHFMAKGRFASYLEPIPSWVIVAPAPALLGASRALDELPA